MAKDNHILQRKKDRLLSKNSIFFAVFIIAACFLFWKCRYGYGNIDESFYLTIPYRLYQGDSLFREEWHLSQMAGFLTLPIMTLYMELKGSTEGILLDMRYICTSIQCLMAVFLYIRLKNMNWLGAAIAAISFMLYTPFGIMALSYNSMGILFLLLSQVIILTAQKKVHIQYMLAGLSFAAAVLCCPYLLLVYVLYLAVVAVAFIKHRGTDTVAVNSPWSIRSAVFFTAGAAFAAVVFAAFVLSRSPLADIIKAFPHIFDDPEHAASYPLYMTVIIFLKNIVVANLWSGVLYCFLALLWILCLLDKKRDQHKIVYTYILMVCVFGLMVSYYHYNHYINHLMWSVNVFAVFLVLLTQNSQIRKTFVFIWIPGILYAYCLNLTSNQRFFAISSAASVATVGSLLMLAIYIREFMSGNYSTRCKRIVSASFCILVCYQIATQAILRYESVFWEDGGMSSLTVEVDCGIEKGLIISEEHFAEYQRIRAVVEKVSGYEKEKVLYLSENTGYYLEGNQEMSTYSAWMSGVNPHSLQRLGAYYEINSHKMPDIIYVEPEYEDISKEYFKQFHYKAQVIDEGIILLPE